MNKKLAIAIALLVVISASVPIVIAASWGASFNTGDEPFMTDGATENTGTQLVWTNQSTPINITNDNHLVDGQDTGPYTTDNSWVIFFFHQLYLDGDTGESSVAEPKYVWVNFTSGSGESAHWVNMTADLEDMGGPDNYWRLELHDTSYMNGTYVHNDTGVTGGYEWDTNEHLELRVGYEAPTNTMDDGTHYYSSGGNKAVDYYIYYYE